MNSRLYYKILRCYINYMPNENSIAWQMHSFSGDPAKECTCSPSTIRFCRLLAERGAKVTGVGPPVIRLVLPNRQPSNPFGLGSATLPTGTSM